MQSVIKHTDHSNTLITRCFISLCNILPFHSLFADLHSCDLQLCHCPLISCCHTYTDCYVTSVESFPVVFTIPASDFGSDSSQSGFCYFKSLFCVQEFGDHPNIVKLLNVIRAQNDKDIYLIFEYMGECCEFLYSHSAAHGSAWGRVKDTVVLSSLTWH